MFGKEVRIYSEADVLQSQLAFLEHGDRPPSAIGKINGRTFVRVTPKELQKHNAQAKTEIESRAERELAKPKGVIKRTLSHTGILFTSGAK